jgi:hypothetical protein
MPAAGEYLTRWKLASWEEPHQGPLNVLLVPFPYHIRASCFRKARAPNRGGAGLDRSGRSAFFEVYPHWLFEHGKRVSARRIATFLADLVAQACTDVGDVHGLILPEAALDASDVEAIGRELMDRTQIEFFITGGISRRTKTSAARNLVYTAIPVREDKELFSWMQYKHHRWCLDQSQICRYHLGSVLDPEKSWWEAIEISKRELDFWVYRHGASLVALICEDLARIDPVQSAVRAIGPNLVIALLMDGPQMERRWSGRYATVLADDPGSAVLTFTSAGLIARSHMPRVPNTLQIGLWKCAGGPVVELELPQGAHALLLSLAEGADEHFTADGRTDEKNTVRLTLGGTIPIVHKTPPTWLKG